MTTFCWLPPERLEIGASAPAVRTCRRSIQSWTSRVSFRRLTETPFRRRSRIGSERFSRTANCGDDALAGAVGGDER